MKLHLGVVDVPYADPDDPKKTLDVTTGQVAEWLEDRYHVMENFYELHRAEIDGAVTDLFRVQLERLMTGAPAQNSSAIFGAGIGAVKVAFNRMLDSGELERIGYPGVPTQAAVERRSLRFKKKRGTRPRPSFIDTGLYESSFIAWLE